jgi:hypothetical protein
LRKTNDTQGVIQNAGVQMWGLRAAFWCALTIISSNLADATARPLRTDIAAGGAELAFLSGREGETPPSGGETSPLMPQEGNNNFDGVWTFTSAGCPYTGSLPAKIVGGKIIIRGGSGHVDPDGTLHSVGAGNGMTLTAFGQLSGNTGSGTFNRSDGCVGSWIAIKRDTTRGRRP